MDKRNFRLARDESLGYCRTSLDGSDNWPKSGRHTECACYNRPVNGHPLPFGGGLENAVSFGRVTTLRASLLRA